MDPGPPRQQTGGSARRRWDIVGILVVVVLIAGGVAYAVVKSGSGGHQRAVKTPAPSTPSTTGTAPSPPSSGHPGAPAVPPAPTGHVAHVPRSIPGDCSRDVTAQLNTWIASVPDNSTLEFTPKACYEIEGTIYVANRNDLLFDGNGAEFLAKTTGAGAKPPPGAHTAWPVGRAQWWIARGRHISLENMVIHGAANLDAPYEGLNWGARPHKSKQLIGQYGLRFAGTDGGLVRGCTITDTFSDLIGVTADRPGSASPLPSRDITIENNVLERSDRDGPSVYDGIDILIAHNTIGDVWGPVVDLEPVPARWQVDYASVVDNTATTHAHYFMTAAGSSKTNDHLLFQGNVDTGGDMSMLIGSKSSSPPIRQDVRILDNRADRANASGTLIAVNGFDHVVVSGNQAPARGTAVTLFNSNGVTISGNHFSGAGAVLATKGSTGAVTQSANSL